MNPDLIRAAENLAKALTRENAALAACDFLAVAQMLDAKLQAVEQMGSAELLPPSPEPIAEEQREEIVLLATRLRELALENRRLLEQAIVVQGKVIGTVVRAVPRAAASRAPRYAADGGMAAVRQLPAMALSTRA